jgi:hypothetical protein
MSLAVSAELLDQIERKITPLGLVAIEIYNVINSCETADQLQAAGALIWEYYGRRRVSNDEAAHLQECLERRRGGPRVSVKGAPIAPLRGRVSRFAPRKHQRSPDRAASRARRRKLGGAGAMPPDLRDHYTEGERSVMCVVTSEIKRHGLCDWPVDKLAAHSGVCRTTAQNALRKGKLRGDITVTVRPLRGGKNLTNIVRICCRQWLAWLKRGFATACCIGLKAVKKLSPTEIIDLRKQESGDEEREFDPSCGAGSPAGGSG